MFLNVGIIGTGYFGRFHAQKVATHPRQRLIGVYDADPARAERTAREFECRAYPSLDALLSDVDAVVVASPAVTHFSTARRAMEKGRHVLLEKPIACDLNEARLLERIARDCAVVCQIGYLLHYSHQQKLLTREISAPELVILKRATPLSGRGADVSVVLDLMIHDFNHLAALGDLGALKSVDAHYASPDTKDCVSAHLEFEDGCRVHLIADRNASVLTQDIHVFEQSLYVKIDAKNRCAFFVRPDGQALSEQWENQDLLYLEHDGFVGACLDGFETGLEIKYALKAQEYAQAVLDALNGNPA